MWQTITDTFSSSYVRMRVNTNGLMSHPPSFHHHFNPNFQIFFFNVNWLTLLSSSFLNLATMPPSDSNISAFFFFLFDLFCFSFEYFFSFLLLQFPKLDFYTISFCFKCYLISLVNILLVTTCTKFDVVTRSLQKVSG